MKEATMPDLLLSDADQTALRSLLATEPDPGSPFPTRPALEAVGRLIPCDAVGVVLADSSGHVLDEVVEPGDYTNELDPVSASTSLSMDLRAGSDHVVQVWMDRRHGTFCSRDLAMLSLLTPALQRLLRSRPTARLPGTLTLQEGRVLSLVGAGWTNAEIAERMCVETCTVRKHLEHVYRKLGVSNRMAAAMVLQGRAAGGPRGSSDDDRRQMFA